MILYVCRARHRYTIDRFLPVLPAEQRGMLDILTYEDMFTTLQIPPANLIFTDFDRLSQYELEFAAAAAEQMRRTCPEARILNHPARFFQRHELLMHLWHAGMNQVRSARLELPLPDLAFPVFLRRESDAQGPETDLLQDRAALDLAVADLRARGVPLRGRLAVEFRNRPDADGLFRKYGAFRVGEQILPQHLQISENWVVKSNSNRLTKAHVAEELDYILTNPHSDAIRRIMDLAGADFGRIDYTVVDGQIVVFEINSNPTFPGIDKEDARQERRQIVRDRLLMAFTWLDTPIDAGNPVRLSLPHPKSHDLSGPKATFPDRPAPGIRRWLDRLKVPGQRKGH
jgi:hypothetical protein